MLIHTQPELVTTPTCPESSMRIHIDPTGGMGQTLYRACAVYYYATSLAFTVAMITVDNMYKRLVMHQTLLKLIMPYRPMCQKVSYVQPFYLLAPPSLAANIHF